MHDIFIRICELLIYGMKFIDLLDLLFCFLFVEKSFTASLFLQQHTCFHNKLASPESETASHL